MAFKCNIYGRVFSRPWFPPIFFSFLRESQKWIFREKKTSENRDSSKNQKSHLPVNAYNLLTIFAKKKKVHVWQHHKYASEYQHSGQKGLIHPLIFDAPLLLDILSYLSEIWSSPSKTLHPLQPLNNFK